MTTFAWVLHNNANYSSRFLVEGLYELGVTDIEHISSREDLLGIRAPDLSSVIDVDSIGSFPDSSRPVRVLASPGFWSRMKHADIIFFQVDPGGNHNAYRAAELIRRHRLFDRVVYIDEDERGSLHPDFRDIFFNSRLALLWHRRRMYDLYGVHPHVVWAGFSALEKRYLRFRKDFSEKGSSVFYRGRGLPGLPNHRQPFIDALIDRDFADAQIMPPLEDNHRAEDFVWQHVTGNRHNVTYYSTLADSKVAVFLNGYNSLGYQFWENAALSCAQVMQSPKRTQWYQWGHDPGDTVEFEFYDPPYVNGKHFLSFESPSEMLEQIEYLLANDSERERMARATYEQAMANDTSMKRAELLLEHLERVP